MSAPELLTDRERQLLKAVHAILDLPRPAAGHYAGRKDAVAERVARLLGTTDALDMLAEITFTRIIEVLDEIAARPLGYEPAASEYSA